MDHNYTILPISDSLPDFNLVLEAALKLVWQVFEEFEAPDYSAEGVEEFRQFIAVDAIRQRIAEKQLLLWGCYDGDQIAGVIAARPPCHLSLLFVDKKYHRQGIARALHETVIEYYMADSSYREMTVNSSPYALAAYGRLGFTATDTEQTVNGIRFIPMKHRFG